MKNYIDKLVKDQVAKFEEVDAQLNQARAERVEIEDDLQKVQEASYFVGKARQSAELKLQLSEINNEIDKLSEKRKSMLISKGEAERIAKEAFGISKSRFSKKYVDPAKELANQIVEIKKEAIEAGKELTNEISDELTRLYPYVDNDGKDRIKNARWTNGNYDSLLNEVEI